MTPLFCEAKVLRYVCSCSGSLIYICFNLIEAEIEIEIETEIQVGIDTEVETETEAAEAALHGRLMGRRVSSWLPQADYREFRILTSHGWNALKDSACHHLEHSRCLSKRNTSSCGIVRALPSSAPDSEFA